MAKKDARTPDYAQMIELLRRGQVDELSRSVEGALENGAEPVEILDRALIRGMRAIGEDFKHNRVYVPEVLIASRAMKAALALLEPRLADWKGKRIGTIVIGTVAGDLHDIGKNLVSILAAGAGFHVVDLGVDVSIDRFVEAAQKHEAGIVGMSSLLTTTMPVMREIVAALKEEGFPGVKTVIGGAPTTPQFAGEIGADGYAPDAGSAIEVFESLL